MNKKLIALALVFCMVLSLAACGAKGPKAEDLHYKWATTVALADFGDTADLADEIGIPLDEATLAALQLDVILEFAADGTAYIMLPEETLGNISTTLLDAYLKYLRDGGFYAMMEEQSGMTKEQIDSYLTVIGMTADEFVEAIASEINSQDMISMIQAAVAQNDADSVRDGAIVGAKFSYTLDGSLLTFTDEDGESKGSMTVEYDAKAGTLLVTTATGEDFTCFIGKTLTKQ